MRSSLWRPIMRVEAVVSETASPNSIYICIDIKLAHEIKIKTREAVAAIPGVVRELYPFP